MTLFDSVTQTKFYQCDICGKYLKFSIVTYDYLDYCDYCFNLKTKKRREKDEKKGMD